MNNCNIPIKMTCPPNSPYASCVRSEVDIPEFSVITSQCNSVDEVLEDVYTLIGSIKSELNLTSLASDCQTLPTVKTVATLIDFLLDGYCAQKTQIDALIAQNITQASQILALQSSVCP
jgi:hypothetical protein